MDIEELKELYDENRELCYVAIIFVSIIFGVFIDFALDAYMNERTPRGLATVIISIIGLCLCVLAIYIEKAEEAKYSAYTASAELEELEETRADAIALKEKANALQEKANALASECERLRSDERSRLEKLQTLNKDLQTLADERQMLLDKLANAETLQASAIANAKANALKPHRPYINAGQNYLLYAVGRAISNHNSSYSAEDKQRAGDAVKGLKIALDEFRDEYKENAEKTILS